MRPMWERYYHDADAIVYVIDAAETSFERLHRSRLAFERMFQNDAVRARARSGLPIMVFANRLDVAYAEYGAGMEMSMKRGSGRRRNGEDGGGKRVVGLRGMSWHLEEEDDFVGGGVMGGTSTRKSSANGDDDDMDAMISRRVVDFEDMAALFGFPRPGRGLGNCTAASDRGNVFLFGGSAKSGEGVRVAMEYLVAQCEKYRRSPSYHLVRDH